MRRMFVLLGKCLKYKEPALLVGDTGTGNDPSPCWFQATSRNGVYSSFMNQTLIKVANIVKDPNPSVL